MSSRKLEYARRKRVEQRRKRRHAALKGWETIRARVRESDDYARKLKEKRREGARKAVFTRQLKAAEKRGANRVKQELLDGGYQGMHGSNPQERVVLKAMIDHEDPQWLFFLKIALEMGYSARQARNAWYSPKVRRAA
jgi:hypothetical protein